MRITFLSALADASGGSLVIAEHARRLHARGHEVTIVTRWPRKLSLRERLREGLRGNGWNAYEEPLRSHFDGLPLPVVKLRAGTVPSAQDLPNADVLIATWWQTVAWATAMPRSKGAPLHFVQGYEVFGPHTKESVEAALRAPLPKVTVSRWLTELVQGLGVRDVVTVPNSIDLERFVLPPRTRQPRPSVGFVYSHEAFKGGDVLARVIGRLRVAFPDLRVVGFGLRKPLAEHAGLADASFVVQPPRAQVPALYAAADVWLVASRLEGFGLPMLEALACGTPVVSTKVGAASDFIVPGETGALVAIDDVDALVAHATTILRWPAERWQRASQAGAATARAWTWEKASAAFEHALSPLSSRRPPQRPA